MALLATFGLAVGIGSTTAIYAVVDAVLLSPLPYELSDRFVALFGMDTTKPTERSGSSYADLLEYQRRSRSFDTFGWFVYAPDDLSLMFHGHPEHVHSLRVTPSVMNSLGVKLLRGQWFKDPLPEPNGYQTAVISSALWHRLGGDPTIVGKPLTLGGRQFTVLGVAPPEFHFPLAGVDRQVEKNDLWTPLDPHAEGQDVNSGIYICYARLRPGVTLAAADAEIKQIAAQIAKSDPANHPAYSARLDSLRDSAVADVRPALLLLFAAAGLLFLITCANVAGLLLARSVTRARETAIRVALGANRRQLAQQYFLEGLFVSLGGAALGVVVSVSLVRLVLNIAGEFNPFANQTAVNVRVFLFVFAAAFLASSLFSLAPLWQALGTAPNSILSGGVRASTGISSRRLSQSLVVAEIALAFTLLALSALLLTQLSELHRVSPGFDADHLLTFQLKTDESQYPEPKLHSYQKKLIETFEAIPGVTGAAFTNELPLAGCCYSTRIYPDGDIVAPQNGRSVDFHGVSANYFKVMRIPLERGRLLTERDTNETLIAVVIDQEAAAHYWPGRNPVGAYGHLRNFSGPRVQVVGVVGNVRNKGLSELTAPEIYLVSGLFQVNPMNFIVRSPRPVNTLVRDLRRAVADIDPTQPIYDIRPMPAVIQTSLTLERLSSVMMTIFAMIAVLMAALGIYGVVSYSVRQRTVEIGTRMALGAQNRDLFKLVLGEGFRMAAYGVLFGAIAAAVATFVLLNVFRMIHEIEIGPFVYSLLLVAAVVFTASFFPAWWRATLLSPMVAIRDESLSVWQSAGRGLRQLLSAFFTPAHRIGDAQAVESATLLSDFINATRQASTFDEALRLALTTLRERLGAATAMLLENISGTEYACVAAVPAGEAACHPLPAPGFLSNRLRFYGLPLPIAAGDLATWSRWASENKPQFNPEIQALTETQTRVAVPLRTKTEILGLLLLGPPLSRSEYTGFELRVLRNCAEQFALMIENARLTGRVVEQEKLRRDVALAAEVQKRLLPEGSPESPAASFAAFSLPARSVGGDYYDFLQIGDHRIGIALADIAGKGIAAALLMSVVQASLRIIASEKGVSLPQLVAQMNRCLYRSTGVNGYATFFYAQLDEHNRQLRYVNAGHNPPYLLRSAQSNGNSHIEELSTGGMIIGMFPHANYEEAAVNLSSGDVLIAFTDGVTEALSPGEEEFGEERLKSLLRHVAHLPVAEMSTHISRELKSWISNADQHDDLTFMVLKVT